MLKRGSVVRSLAGRDKDSLLAVVEVTEKGVLICDGKERPVERPKFKNLRHIGETGAQLPEETISRNKALRKALAGLEDCV
ncbi:MAG: KOW domain-containing RNA-binding protein [Clostridia bacterium]|nr:KOW domain-containing RNA-binding protein [Clostridia bacterium]